MKLYIECDPKKELPETEGDYIGIDRNGRVQNVRWIGPDYNGFISEDGYNEDEATKIWLRPITRQEYLDIILPSEEEIKNCVVYIEQNPEATERLTAKSILSLLREKK